MWVVKFLIKKMCRRINFHARCPVRITGALQGVHRVQSADSWYSVGAIDMVERGVLFQAQKVDKTRFLGISHLLCNR